jgi:hypothetical protein
MNAEPNAMERKPLKTMLIALAYPALQRLPSAQWEAALARARATEFDLVERIGMLLVMAVVAYLLRFEAQQTVELALPIRYLAQFSAAALLIVPAAAPFFLRRTRRGLDHELECRLGARFASLPRSSHD